MLIQDMVVSIAGDERPLRRSLERSVSDIKQFQDTAARAMAKPLRMQMDVGKEQALRDISEVDRVMARAYARWNRPMPTGPSPLQLGYMGATGRYDSAPDAATMARMGGNSGGILQDMVGLRSGLPEKTGGELAKSLITGLRSEFRASIADAREELFRGLINQQEFEARSRQAAQAMNRGILSGIERIGDSGKMTGALHAKLVAELQVAGLAGADAMTNAMKARMQARGAELAAITAANMRRAMNVPVAGAGGAMAGGRAFGVANQAIVGSAFALESVIRAEGKAEKAAVGLRSALQTTALAALAFGPKGWAVSAAALGLTVLVDKFSGASREAREFKAQLDGLIDAGDWKTITENMATLWRGRPSAGAGMGGGFAGSILDLEAQKRQAQETINSLTGAHARPGEDTDKLVAAERARIRSLSKQLEPLWKEFNELRDRQLNRPSALPDIMGMPTVTTSANSSGRQAVEDAKAQAQAMVEARNSVSTLLTAWDQLIERKEGVNDLLALLQGKYGDLKTQLANMPNPFSEQAVAVRGMVMDMEKLVGSAVKGVNLPGLDALPGFGLLPGMTAEGRIPLPEGTGGIMGTKKERDPSLGEMFMKDLSEIPMALKTTLISSFGPLAAVMEILRPGLEVVTGLFNSLLAPLGAVVQVVGTMLEPVFRLLFPIVKAVAIGLSYLGEMIARVVAGIAQAVGGLLVGIGNLLNKLPGSIGNPIKRLGESVLNFANGVKASANSMATARRELQGMKFGETANDITGLGTAARATAESLSNVPEIFKLTLAQLRHFGIETVYGQQQQAPPTGAASSPTVITFGDINVNEVSGDPRETAKAVVRELESVANSYGMGTPWSTVPSTGL